MPNKISQFWQELKRRKVVRVITVYAAAAFVILELVSIIVEPLKLPEWFLPMVIVLLCIGFIIAVILSWIYDIHPEGGVVKTEPAHKIKEEDIHKISNSWKIASYISFVVIVGLIVFNILSSRNRSREITDLEKSIAVLPFLNMSVGEEYSHMGNAIADEIILELQKIKAFDRVLSFSSTMQYMESRPAIPEIAENLGVNYIIEGSIQRRVEKLSIRVQVIRAKYEDHVWGHKYDRKWEDIHTIQDEIAFNVAHELSMVLSPEEKQHIEKIPTNDLTAYNFYQKGREKHQMYLSDNNNTEALIRAEEFYQYALEYDSTYALAYVGLAGVYWIKHYSETILSESFMDSVFTLANIALSYDNQLAEAYLTIGNYYAANGNPEQALEEYEKVIELNPNEWRAYVAKGELFLFMDFVQEIDNYYKASSLLRGPELPSVIEKIQGVCSRAGFPENEEYFSQEVLKLDGDSLKYYMHLGRQEYLYQGNIEKAIEYLKKGHALDTSNQTIIGRLADRYINLKQYEKALQYIQKRRGRLRKNLQLGYIYWQWGDKQKAMNYFNELIEYYSRLHELERGGYSSYSSYYFLAIVYAIRGENYKAYKNLRLWIQKSQVIPLYRIVSFNTEPYFDNIRDEPEFLQIVADADAKYQVEHERVRKWLEENDMLK